MQHWQQHILHQQDTEFVLPRLQPRTVCIWLHIKAAKGQLQWQMRAILFSPVSGELIST